MLGRLLLVSALLVLLLPPSAAAQVDGPRYVVQPGDTLYDIAVRFGVGLDALQAANPGVDPAALGVGQVLAIPGYGDVTGTLATHRLEPGESLDSLGLRLGLDRALLIRLNRVVNPDLLYMNESVVVVDQADEAGAVPAGAGHVAHPGQSWLSLAAGANQNPWALARLNRLANPGRVPPGALVVVPGGDAPTTALPFPLRALHISPLPPEQGRTVSIQIDLADEAEVAALTGSLGDWPLRFSPASPEAAVALHGIDRLSEPNLYRLVIGVTDAGGRQFGFSQMLPVRDGGYVLDPPLTVNPATIDPAVTGPELEQIRALVAPLSPVRFWDGPFALPSVGGLRSVYGSLRSYNGGPYDSFHSGADFSGAEDRPVTAPAAGIVVFTGELTVRGNATVIDHGWGVYSGYWHQSQILVSAGERVQAGQVIGYQGATGRVTGPHLHWELWVNGFQVDPLQWTERAFP